MKFKITVFILFVIGYCNQDKIIGKYKDNFGSEFLFNSDSTYEFNNTYHNTGFWSKGKWKVKNDTIFLKAIPIYDTLRISGKKDSLILSRTKTPKLILASSVGKIIWPESSSEQDLHNGKLFFRDDKLYKIDREGKLITAKKTHSFSRSIEKFDPWFTRIEE
jgi:hypothetical protein